MATDDIRELQYLLQELDKAIAELDSRGQALAKAEYAYRTMMSKALLSGRAEGYPATLLLDICRGLDSVGNARLDRDVKKAMYDTTRERINIIKLQARMIDSQLSRDLELAGKV
ncbi:MAG: hypothetical protein GX777_05980 [Fastidiosipila sp.]|nr:hypothetical protein [Fastidiosipila sp.]